MSLKIVFDSYAVIKVANSDPEEFVIAFQASRPEQGQPFMRTSEPLSEQGLRDELQKMGLDGGHIEQLIAQARANPN